MPIQARFTQYGLYARLIYSWRFLCYCFDLELGCSHPKAQGSAVRKNNTESIGKLFCKKYVSFVTFFTVSTVRNNIFYNYNEKHKHVPFLKCLEWIFYNIDLPACAFRPLTTGTSQLHFRNIFTTFLTTPRARLRAWYIIFSYLTEHIRANMSFVRREYTSLKVSKLS